MHPSSLMVFTWVLILVAFRLLWAGSSVASAAALGRIPVSKKLRYWFFDERP